jgi:hypothetical protein
VLPGLYGEWLPDAGPSATHIEPITTNHVMLEEPPQYLPSQIVLEIISVLFLTRNDGMEY